MSEPAPGTRPAGARARPSRARRAYRILAALLLVGVLIAVVLRAPSAVHDFTQAFTHLRVNRLPWLVAAVAAEFVSFVFYAVIQDTLLRAGCERVTLGVLLRLSIASSGLRALLPAGAVPSSGWLYGEYRNIGVPGPVSLYAVLASGFVSTVSLLALLLTGSAIAGVTGAALLVPASVVLVVGSAGFIAIVHRLQLCARLVGTHSGRMARVARRALHVAGQVAHIRAGWRRGAWSFGAAAGNWLADIICLIGAFALLDVHIPWRALLFAYCASQLAGSVVPLPGGLGAVEGGLVGAFDATGLPVGEALAVAIVYRVITYWGVALIGGIELASLSRHPPARDAAERLGPSSEDEQADAVMGRSAAAGSRERSA